jgi:tight adherence protein B
MRRWAVAAICTGVVVGAGAPSFGLGAESVDFVDLSDFPVVHLVITSPGGVIGATDVVVRQDGEPVVATVTPLRSEPIEMVVLIDASGSMAGSAIESARQSAIDFIDALPADSEIAVVAFGNEVSTVAPLGSSLEELVDAIGALEAGGETALYDAVLAAVRVVDLASGTRQFIVLLSDGGDTVSAVDLDAVTSALSGLEVGFYAIELPSLELDRSALEAMADATGGTVVPAADAEGLAAVYGDIAEDVTSQYAISFEAVHGGPSHVDVAVTSTSGQVLYAADLDLPALGERGPLVTLPVAPERVPTEAASRVISSPSLLHRAWVFDVGIALLAVTLLVVLAFALMPATDGGRRGSILAGDSPPRLRRGSRLAQMVPGAAEGIFRRRASRGIDAALEAAGIALRGSEFLAIVALAALVGASIGILSGSPMLGLLLLVGAITLPRLWVSRAAERRRREFADQLEGSLQLMAGTLRAGYGLTHAVSTVAEEAGSPSKEEFGRVVVEVRLGRELPESLRALANRMRNEDFSWVADAIAIQQDVGGNLAEVLDGVGATIRDRNNIRRQVQALSAEGRISAAVLIALPFALAGIIALVNPGYLDALFETPGGRVMLGVGGVLMTLGVLWIRRLIRIVF